MCGILLHLPRQRQLAGEARHARPDAQNAHLGQVRRGPRGLFHRQLALYRPAHQKYYRRDSDVIYPCCHINESPFVEKEDFYLTVGRLTWYKRVDLAVQACTRLNKRLVVIGGGGEMDKLRAMAGPTIEFKGGGLSDEEVRSYYLRAKGFLSRVKRTLASPRRGPERGHAGAGLWPRRRVRERAARQDRLLV